MRRGPPPVDPSKSYVNVGSEEQMEIIGYKRNWVKTTVVWFFVIATVGFLRLVFYWKPNWMLILTHDKTQLKNCTSVLLTNHYQESFVSKVSVFDMSNNKNVGYDAVSNRSIRCKKMNYIWNGEADKFLQINGLPLERVYCSRFESVTALTTEEQSSRRKFYGSNKIEIHVTPVITLLFKEVLNPFYVFQLFSVCLWMSDQYYYYAGAIILVSIISIVVTVYQTRIMQRQLKNTITSSTIVTVKSKSGERKAVNSEMLVPGDIIEIPSDMSMMQCDAVLLSGNCVINESMLTGESVPVTKTPISNAANVEHDALFDFHKHSNHLLFSGTQVLQTRCAKNSLVEALVIRTGFSTTKGQLVRSIKYPKPYNFKFERDSYYFIGILASFAAIGFIYTIVLMNARGESVREMVIRALDLFTIAVPPALPATMTIGVMYALIRLKQSGIYCISSSNISVCGAINTVCFDKTGTLTEDQLDFCNVTLSENGTFKAPMVSLDKCSQLTALECMAACHSLTLLNGNLCGDPIDIVMFTSTKSTLEEHNDFDTRFGFHVPSIVRHDHPSLADGKNEVAIIRQLTFTPELQRMSVVTQRLGQQSFTIYTKGAPETIANLCTPNTVPNNFPDVLKSFAAKGHRIIALAYRSLPVDVSHSDANKLSREHLEQDLTFVGLLVLANKLKPETNAVIRELNDVNIRNIMITGDNIQTAVTVARECAIVKQSDPIILLTCDPQYDHQLHFSYIDNVNLKSDVEDSKQGSYVDIDKDLSPMALIGLTWSLIREHHSNLIPMVLRRTAVFARMSPEQKSQVVSSLQDLGLYVCMCGDGANDCGALKAAHAGIALTSAEASVASAFTSTQQNISCIPTLIKNGRCALVTSVGVFKFMALYSITQFTSVCLLYWISANLTDFGFLYIDLAVITPISIFYGKTGPYSKLVKEPPSVSLISLSPILSLLLHMLLQGTVQVLAFLSVRGQGWHIPYEGTGHNYASHENATIFLLSCFIYISLAVVFSKGAPYRQPYFRNYLLTIVTVIILIFTVYITVGDPATVPQLEIKDIPSLEYKLLIVGLAVAHFLAAMILEIFILDSSFTKVWLQKVVKNAFSKRFRSKSVDHWSPMYSTGDNYTSQTETSSLDLPNRFTAGLKDAPSNDHKITASSQL